MATKKISELPLVNRVSGSQVAGGSVLPIVIGGGIQGTTNQISVEDFSLFVNAYNATTSSNTFIGTQNVTGDVNISGRLTVKEVVAQYETASILFSTGSTKLGDQLTDKHEFTGSTNITGSLTADGFITLNGQSLNNAFDRIHQATHSLQLATASIQAYTASADSRFLLLQQTTQSLQQATASLQQATASIQAYTASADSRFLLLQQTTQSLQVATASLQFHSASVNAQLLAIQQTTQSLQVATASLQFHSASVDAQLLAIQQTTQSLQVATASLNQFSASTNAHIVGISAFTSSQLAVNLGNSIYTASVDSHIVGISTYTSSVRDTLARVHQATQSLQVATASLQQFTASQDVRNFVVSQVTGSLIGITNGLMAFTAALDNTYATDAQLYQLYQATRSLELHSGSMIGVTNGLMAYTASNSTLNTGLRGEVDGIEAYTASLKGQAIVSSSTQVQNYDIFALNSNLYNGTGSIKAEVAGIESYTASLKAAAIISSSQQITNYYKFAETASANTFYGDQTITGSLAIKDSETNFLIEGNGFSQTYLTSNGAIVLNPGYGGIEMVGSYRTFKATDITADGFVSGEIRATNNVVSSSQQITEYNTFAVTSSVNTFYGNQTISGSLRVTAPIRTNIISGGLDVNGGITGSFKGALDGVAAYASLLAVSSVGTTTDTSLYPTFTLSPVLGSYSGLYSHLSGSFFLNGVTRQVVINDGGLLVTGSLIANSGITGSLMATNGVVSSSQQITNYYKFAETASANTFYGNQTIVGSITARSGVFTAPNNVIGTLLIQGGKEEGAINETNSRLDFGSNDPSVGENDGIKSGGRISSVIENANGAHVGMAFSTYQQGRTPDLREEVRITNTGDLTLNNGNLVIGTSGKGIDFSATSNSSGTMGSELLNDYEEGTWTPILADASTAGNTATGAFSGFYTKIGRLVTLQATCGTITTTGMTGANTLYIRGLPFAIAGSTQLSAGAANFYNVVMGANGSIAWINAAAGTTYIRILKQASGTTNADLIVSNVTSTTGEISFTIQYYA